MCEDDEEKPAGKADSLCSGQAERSPVLTRLGGQGGWVTGSERDRQGSDWRLLKSPAFVKA